MKKVTNSKGIAYYGKKLFILAVVVVQITIQLFVAACKPKSVAKSDSITPTPVTNSQLSNNNPVLLETEAPIDETSTPMDAGLITPEAENILQAKDLISISSDEDLKIIEEAAKKYYEEITKHSTDELKYYYSYDFVLANIKNFRGEFVGLYDYQWDKNNNPDISVKGSCFSDMFGFTGIHYSLFLNELTYSFSNNEDFDPFFFPGSTFLKLTDSTKNFSGLDLIEMQDKLFEDMCGSINDEWSVFSKKASKYQMFVEAFYLHQAESPVIDGSVLTSFKNAHPCIKLMLLCSAWDQLKVAYLAELYKGQSVTGDFESTITTLVNMIIKDLNKDSELFYEIVPLMDAYIEAIKSGELTVVENGEELKLEYTPTPGS